MEIRSLELVFYFSYELTSSLVFLSTYELTTLFRKSKYGDSIYLPKDHWINLPNTSTQHNSFDPSLTKPGSSPLILSDHNVYSQLRDSLQPQDQRGD